MLTLSKSAWHVAELLPELTASPTVTLAGIGTAIGEAAYSVQLTPLEDR
jgi:hypothetical protein